VRFVFVLLPDRSNKGNKEEEQARKPSFTGIRYHLPDHDNTMRESSVLDACDQVVRNRASPVLSCIGKLGKSRIEELLVVRQTEIVGLAFVNGLQ